MRRVLLLALLLAACGPEAVSVVTDDTAAKYIAVDIQSDWSLTLTGLCNEGSGTLNISSSYATDGEALGNGTWWCGPEGGNASLTVFTSGGATLQLFRTAGTNPVTWELVGSYTPRVMVGNGAYNWSANHR
jgi:hypothetical protein